MKKRVFISTCAVALLVCFTVFAGDKDKKVKPTCPVTGKAFKKEFSVSHNGGNVFFCCGNCPKAFEKNTKKYTVKANHQLVLTKQAKCVKCPLTGRKINKETFISVKGSKVGFCCGNCQGKVEKAKGDKQIELIFNDKAFKKGFEIAKKEK